MLLIDYKGTAWHENNANTVEIDGTYEVVETLPVEPSNYVWSPTWILESEEGEYYAVEIPEIIYISGKPLPDIREALRNFDLDCWLAVERGFAG